MNVYGTYQRLGLHVAASNRTVIAAARKRLSHKSMRPEFRVERHRYYRAILRCHEEAFELFRKVVTGEV